MRLRYQSRHNLADLTRFPEGYEFQHGLIDGAQRSVILLTPPEQVAVRREDGSWYRRPRDDSPELLDGPPPYTRTWYLSYLTNNNLPLWFLSPEHIAMLQHHAERDYLGLARDPPPSVRAPPPKNYHEARYPQAPLYPRPDTYNDQTYAYDLTAAEYLRVARRFPATSVNIMNNDYRIFVASSGHIIIRHRGENGGLGQHERLLNSDDVAWETENETAARASYVVEGDDDGTTAATAGAGLPQTARDSVVAAARSADGDLARAAGDYVDIDQLPNGLGELRFLNVYEARIARSLGMNRPEAVVLARQNGGITIGMTTADRPMVVFEPDRRYFNPTRQPIVAGHWEYLTTIGDGSARALAWINFGNQDEFRSNATPSATDIWNLRQRVQTRVADGQIDDDFTAEIDLVWVVDDGHDAPEVTSPFSEYSTSFLDQFLTKFEGNYESETSSSVNPPDADVVDPETGLHHAPLNNDANDQTGPYGERFYQSRLINGHQYTVDRSRAHAGVPQPHKFYIVTKKGIWTCYSKYNTVDWEDKDSVESLNKWREQAFSRNGWPAKRKATRSFYSEVEKNHLFSLIKAAGGQKPDITMAELTEEFNRRFPTGPRRDVTGITGILERLKQEYDTYGGHRKPKKDRKRKRDAEEDQDGDNEE